MASDIGYSIFSAAADAYPLRDRLAPRTALVSARFREQAFVPWLLAAVDAFVAQASLTLAQVLWRHSGLAGVASGISHDIGVSAAFLWMPLAYYLGGLYPGYGLSEVERMRRRVIGASLMFATLAGWENLVDRRLWYTPVLSLAFLFSLLSVPIEALVVTLLIRWNRWGAPAAILSANRAGIVVARALRAAPAVGLRPLAIFTHDERTWGTELDGFPVLGSPAMANWMACEVPVAVVAMPTLKRTELARLVEGLPFRRVIVIPEIGPLQSLWVNARDLGGALGLELTRNLLIKRNYYLKRAADYVLSAPLFLLSLPLLALLALWIKRASAGPAFYSQVREGKGGKPIRIWKLRTMRLDAEETLARYLAGHPEEREHWRRFFKLKKDPRIIGGIGRFLRKTSLDELPQLWNVLRGDLSLVGPRPFPLYHMKSFEEDFRLLRRGVMPGITGFWQVSSRSDGDLKEQEKLDTYYIRNWSPWLDAYILGRTALVVLFCRGAY